MQILQSEACFLNLVGLGYVRGIPGFPFLELIRILPFLRIVGPRVCLIFTSQASRAAWVGYFSDGVKP